MIHSNLPLRYQWGAFLLMLPLIPFAPDLSLACGTQPVACSLLLHPFVHANLIHWALNFFTWLFIWRYVSLWRLSMAYISAVLAGFIWTCLPTSTNLHLCGYSGIICWFFGLLVPVRGIPYLFRMLPFLLIPFFFPGIAASVHMTCFLLGWFYSLIIHQR